MDEVGGGSMVLVNTASIEIFLVVVVGGGVDYGGGGE